MQLHARRCCARAHTTPLRPLDTSCEACLLTIIALIVVLPVACLRAQVALALGVLAWRRPQVFAPSTVAAAVAAPARRAARWAGSLASPAGGALTEDGARRLVLDWQRAKAAATGAPAWSWVGVCVLGWPRRQEESACCLVLDLQRAEAAATGTPSRTRVLVEGLFEDLR